MPKPSSEFEVAEREKSLWYGAPGTGKTFAAGTAPAPYFLVFGAPNELKPLFAPAFVEKHGKRDFLWDNVQEKVGPRGQFTTPEAFDAACDLLDRALESDRKDGPHWETLVVDPATMLLTYQMNKAMDVSYQLAGSTEKNVMKKFRQYGVINPADADWGLQKSLTDQFVEWLLALDKHVILIAHEWTQTTVDRATRLETVHAIKPWFTGTHRESIPRYFDNVWRFQIAGGGRGTRYQIRTQGTQIVYAKTRLGGVLPEIVEDLDVTETFRLLQEASPNRKEEAISATG